MFNWKKLFGSLLLFAVLVAPARADIYLDTTSRSLEVLLGGAVTTNQLPVVVSYTDLNNSTFAATAAASSNTVTNSTTPVTVAAAPGATTTRVVKYFSTYNADTAPATVTVRYNDNTTTRIEIKVTLQTGESLFYGGAKWYVTTASGGIKSTGVSSLTGTANEITVSTPTGDPVLSLPAALTLTDKTVTGGTLSGVTLSGATTLGNITVATPWTVTETSELLRLVSGALLLATTVNTGTVAGALVLANNTPIQAVIGSGTSVVGLWKLLSTNGAVIGSGTSASVAVDGTLTITDMQKGVVIIGESSFDACAVFIVNAGSTTEWNDPQGIFSNTVDTASSINVYITGGNLTIQNKRAGALTFQYILLKMGSF